MFKTKLLTICLLGFSLSSNAKESSESYYYCLSNPSSLSIYTNDDGQYFLDLGKGQLLLKKISDDGTTSVHQNGDYVLSLEESTFTFKGKVIPTTYARVSQDGGENFEDCAFG